MDKLKMLEMNRLLKELDYLESEQAYKNEIIVEIDSEFINGVNEFLKSHPELKELFDKRIKSRVDETIRKKQEEAGKGRHFTPNGEPIKRVFDQDRKEIVHKFDENGEYVPPTDENGNPIALFDKKGRPVEQKRDESGKAQPPIMDLQEAEEEETGEKEEEEERPEEPETEESLEKKKKEEVKSKKIKKLYREIVKQTHPDKVKNARLNEIYIKATGFYDSNDLIAIYSVCNELRIDYELDEIDYELIKIKINALREKIKFMESTFTWKWYKSENEEERQRLIVNYIKNQLK